MPKTKSNQTLKAQLNVKPKARPKQTNGATRTRNIANTNRATRLLRPLRTLYMAYGNDKPVSDAALVRWAVSTIREQTTRAGAVKAKLDGICQLYVANGGVL